MTKDIQLEFLIANIRATYYQAIQYTSIEEAGVTWYNKAHQKALKLAKRYNVDTDAVCGIIAALSPNNQWERNLIDTESLLLAKSRLRSINDFKCCTYNQNKLKAWKIANGDNPLDILSGNKVVSFYQCILNPIDPNLVCIDSHAINIALGRMATIAQTPSLSNQEYATFAVAYKQTTRWINSENDYLVIPMQVQAITWLYYRAMRGIADSLGNYGSVLSKLEGN